MVLAGDGVEIHTREIAHERRFAVLIYGRLTDEPVDAAVLLAVVEGQPRQTVRALSQVWIDGRWKRMREAVLNARRLEESRKQGKQEEAVPSPPAQEEQRNMGKLLTTAGFSITLAVMVWGLSVAAPTLWPWHFAAVAYSLLVGWVVGRDGWR